MNCIWDDAVIYMDVQIWVITRCHQQTREYQVYKQNADAKRGAVDFRLAVVFDGSKILSCADTLSRMY